ncbi:MAG: DUF2147 domain-containing protein [Bacteroidota bacterium]
MKQTIIFFTLLMVAATVQGLAQTSGDKICGTWVNEEKTSHIEVYKESGKYFAKISWMKEPNTSSGKPKTDRNNPDSKLRDQPILGLVIVSDVEYRGGKWKNGTLYSPQKGQTVNCSFDLASEGELLLTASKGFFSTTKTWTRL